MSAEFEAKCSAGVKLTCCLLYMPRLGALCKMEGCSNTGMGYSCILPEQCHHDSCLFTASTSTALQTLVDPWLPVTGVLDLQCIEVIKHHVSCWITAGQEVLLQASVAM